jgi:hypothetical protein
MNGPASVAIVEAVASRQQDSRHKASEERCRTHVHHESNMHGWNEVVESHVHVG